MDSLFGNVDIIMTADWFLPRLIGTYTIIEYYKILDHFFDTIFLYMHAIRILQILPNSNIEIHYKNLSSSLKNK